MNMNKIVAAVVAGLLAATPIAASAQDYGRYSDAAAQTELSRLAA
jgi:Ni/Co efflux regulator RcnB